MPSGSCASLIQLPGHVRAIVDEARRAVLATVAQDGEPRLVPVCFAIRAGEIVTAVDEKPKSTLSLARLQHVRERGRATLLVDRWDEDWTALGWVMIRGDARIDVAGSASDELLERYPQYSSYASDGPVIAIRPTTIRWWLFQAG